MVTYNLRYVFLADIIDDADVFDHINSVSYGDADLTLVSKKTFFDNILHDISDSCDEDELEEIKDQIEALDDDVYLAIIG